MIDLILQTEVKLPVAREGHYQAKYRKAFSLIHGKFTEDLCARLELLDGWASIKEELNMLGLLHEIKKIQTNMMRHSTLNCLSTMLPENCIHSYRVHIPRWLLTWSNSRQGRRLQKRQPAAMKQKGSSWTHYSKPMAPQTPAQSPAPPAQRRRDSPGSATSLYHLSKAQTSRGMERSTNTYPTTIP